ncbi:MAG: hypothetical protein IPH39_04680 [Sulfuritalea sp.]|nr:hypothetical protein [Sulfuritalea sp.]
MQPGAPLTILLKPSRRLLAIQLAVHGIAAASVLLSSIPGWMAALTLVLVGYSLARLRGASFPVRLILRDQGQFETVGAGDTATEALVHPQTVVMAALIVLLYRQEGRVRSLTLAGDSLSPEDARQLRLWLRWRAAPGQPA